MRTSQLVIQKVANGYIVSAPFQPTVIRQEDTFRQQARIMREEFHGDSELSKLQNEASDNESDKDIKIETEESVFVFKTMDELIGFCKLYL